jgi:hypothetical protein
VSKYILSSLLENARLVCGYHVLDVNERVRTSSLLQNLQGIVDEIPNILVETLVVIDTIATVH